MPRKPPTPCAHPGCPALIDSRFCTSHQRTHRQRNDRRRGSSADRGYDTRWRKARAAYLREHPTCVMCERDGRFTAAAVVDHITPHRGDQTLFWDRTNWQALCASCHSQKTAQKDGGFGNNSNHCCGEDR